VSCNSPSAAECAEMADEIVGAFSTLYPRLALPLDVWNTLREMIEREIRAHFHPTDTFGAGNLARNELYTQAAQATGLR
jgi:hypothetical protein